MLYNSQFPVLPFVFDGGIIAFLLLFRYPLSICLITYQMDSTFELVQCLHAYFSAPNQQPFDRHELKVKNNDI